MSQGIVSSTPDIAPPGQDFIQISANVVNRLNDRPMPLADVIGGQVFPLGLDGYSNFMLQVPTADDPNSTSDQCPGTPDLSNPFGTTYNSGASFGIDPAPGTCFISVLPFGPGGFLGPSTLGATTQTVAPGSSTAVTFDGGPVLSSTNLSSLVFYMQFWTSANTGNINAPTPADFTTLKIPLPNPTKINYGG